MQVQLRLMNHVAPKGGNDLGQTRFPTANDLAVFLNALNAIPVRRIDFLRLEPDADIDVARFRVRRRKTLILQHLG
jgi:hypothetical protein